MHRAACFKHQARQQSIFFGRQNQLFTAHPDLTATHIQRQVANNQLTFALIIMAS